MGLYWSGPPGVIRDHKLAADSILLGWHNVFCFLFLLFGFEWLWVSYALLFTVRLAAPYLTHTFSMTCLAPIGIELVIQIKLLNETEFSQVKQGKVQSKTDTFSSS